MNAVLDRLYREREVTHRDGRRFPVAPPGLPPQRGMYLFELVRQLRPALTIETGFAYGVSALFLAEALRRNGRGRHIAIDPFARSRFDGLGLAHLDEAGLGSLVTLYEEPAELCLPRLLADGLRVEFAFVDGLHLFDHVVAECLFLAMALGRGGLLVVDDTNLPAVGRACDFFAANRDDFEEITEGRRPGALRRLLERPLPPPPLLRLFRRVAEADRRDWNHFVPF